jgi:hypothetical protein
VVVGIVVSIASDLLTLATDTAVFVLEGVLVRVRVEIDLGVLMTEGKYIVVVDIYGSFVSRAALGMEECH